MYFLTVYQICWKKIHTTLESLIIQMNIVLEQTMRNKKTQRTDILNNFISKTYKCHERNAKHSKRNKHI